MVGGDRSAALFAAMIGAILFNALFYLLVTGGFSWAGMKEEMRLTFSAWKRRFYAYVAHKRKVGFTLIELSIVLIIITLIVGGVLVGQTLIKSAKVQQTGTLLEQFDTAANAFQLKYQCLPGDCPNATSFGFAYNGNGDGRIYGVDGGGHTNDGQENFYFFQDLIDAGLVSDTRVCTQMHFTCAPSLYGYSQTVGLMLPTGLFGEGGVQTLPVAYGAITLINTYVVNQGPSAAGYTLPYNHMYFFSILTDQTWGVMGALTASQLDKKFDDGYPLSGKIRALGPDTDGGLQVWDDSWFRWNGQGCMNRTTTPYSYQSTDTGNPGCALTWGAGF